MSPTIAATTMFRAPSILVLSPPELIHLIAPKMIKMRAAIEARTMAPTIILLIMLPAFSADELLQRVLKRVSPVSQGPTLTEVGAAKIVIWDMPISEAEMRRIVKIFFNI